MPKRKPNPAVRVDALLKRHRAKFGDVPTTIFYWDQEDLCRRLEKALRTGKPVTSEDLGTTCPPGCVI